MTQIEWTHMPGFKGETWNPVVGCQIVSKGCTNCYAMRQAARLLDGNVKTPHYAGTTKRVNGQAVWTGKIGIAPDAAFTAPLRAKAPRCYFVNSMGDLFAEGVPDDAIDRALAVMALTPQHRYLILTKRPDRMRAWFEGVERRAAENDLDPSDYLLTHCIDDAWWSRVRASCADWPLLNVWLGVSVEDQAAADSRIPDLLATPAAVRFISAEPLLGPVWLEPWLAWPDPRAEVGDVAWGCQGCDADDYPCSCPLADAVIVSHEFGPWDENGCPTHVHDERRTLDWVIAGGESGKGARPMHPDWARSLRDQCAAAGVPFFFKQWGEWLPFDDAIDVDGVDVFNGETAGFGGDDPGGNPQMLRVGKKAAGALLDGALHRAFPAAAERRDAA
jgi:protein gp37